MHQPVVGLKSTLCRGNNGLKRIKKLDENNIHKDLDKTHFHM